MSTLSPRDLALLRQIAPAPTPPTMPPKRQPAPLRPVTPPPPPPVPPLPYKPGANNDDDYGKPGGRTTRGPVTYHPDAEPKPGTPGAAPRPDFADDIDRLVAALVADGTLTVDPVTGEYRATRRRHWRYPTEEEQSWTA